MRTPLILQAQETECCIAVLAIMLAHFGRHATLAELRELTGISRHCLHAGDIARAARHYGLSARVLRKEPETLAALGLPLIVHLDFIHFAVVEEITERRVRINDPARGQTWLAREEFDERFTGIAIALAPGPDFQPAGAARALWPRLRTLLADAGKGTLPGIAAAVLALSAAPVLLAAAIPAARDPAVLVVLAGAALAGRAAARWLLEQLLDRGERHLGTALRQRLCDHLTRQPQAFFDYRVPAALHRLAALPATMAATLRRDIALPLAEAADAALLLAALAVLAPLPALGAAGILALAAGAMTWQVHAARWTLQPWLAGGSATPPGAKDDLEQAATLDQAAERLQASAGAHADAARQAQQAAPALRRLYLPAQAAALLIALLPVLAGMDAVQAVAFLLLALAPARLLPALARLPAVLYQLRGQLQLLDDVRHEPGHPSGQPAAPRPAPDGPLSAHDLVFGYARTREPVLHGVSLTVAPGELLGIAGAAGGGKSTLAKLLCGLATPWSGTVTLGGHDVAQLAPGTIAWLDKQPFFHTGSVRDNLRLWQPAAPLSDDALWQALRDACVDDVIAARGGLDARMGADGAGFSGGQRQRLAIARALAAAPRCVILDEVTDGLDPVLERALLANLRRRGCTVIVVSHRIGTLRACDRVLHLEHGRIGGQPPAACGAAGIPDLAAELPEVPPPVPDAAMLHACLRALCRHAGPPSRDGSMAPLAGPAAARSRGQVVDAAARAHGLALRPVRMTVACWWRMDPGPLLVFRRGDGAPAVLLPHAGQPGRFTVIDANGRRPLASQPAATFDVAAWAPMPHSPSVPAWLRSAAAPGIYGVLLACVLAAAPFSLPAALSLLAAALLWSWQADTRIGRITEHAAAAVAARLHARLYALAPAALQRHGSTLLHEGAQAGARLVLMLQDRAGGIALPLRAATLAACVAGLCMLAPSLWWLWLGAPLAAWLPLAWQATAAQARCRLRHAHVERRRHRFLFTVLAHATTLRAAGRVQAALAHWLALPWRAPASLRRADQAAVAWRDAWPLAALALLPALLSAYLPAMSPGVVPALALVLLFERALHEAGRLGAFAGRWLDTLPERRAMALLSCAPVAPPAAGEPFSAAPALAIRDARYTYPGSGRPALDGVTLDLPAGRITALAGPSGSGKSTLLRALPGFLPLAGGVIECDGGPADGAALARLRSTLGIVAQDETLEIAGPLRWQLAGNGDWPLAEVQAALRAAELADDVARMPMGLQTIVDAANLSTGQVQRLLIARCLLRRPRVLVLDEATSALPDALQQRVLANVRALGITCLLVSHRASALACADQVAVMAAGRIVCSGAPDDPAVRAALLAHAGQEQRDDVEASPQPLDVPAPSQPQGTVRRGLFRAVALERYQGTGPVTAPLLLAHPLRRGVMAGATIVLLAAAALV
ncbi:ATP-binding cassette domain-containing protein [Pseudoduganella albidiflava]|uniref:ATP-binding cassette domain-containing protein n=1 Tax=Pseudoduganella albidiflava TaxID=321983 RepID=A0ABX5S0F6_9BURK|nr:ATP-binding cassette domain-containing protein [Pseudoduganella albidiflava]QBI03762.1 ATP-binding cassette domain-containing protein [Pseudoduganella albidiflava]